MSTQARITVCAACLRASCWQGHFYCDDYRTADVVEKTPTELALLDREHADYFNPEYYSGGNFIGRHRRKPGSPGTNDVS